MTKQYFQIDFGAGFLHAEYLSKHFDDFARELETVGYARLTIRGYAGSVAHFGHWAQQNKLALQGWNYDTVANFSRHQCRCPGGRRRENISIKYSRRVQRFINYLGRHKIISTVAHARQPKPSEFHDWLVQHRGVCAQTIERYELALAKLLPPGGVEAYMLTAQWVRALVLDKAQCQSLPQTNKMVLAFRAYLKFLASQGRCQPGLDQAIPRIPQWRLAALPRYLPPQDVERVIASCSSDVSAHSAP